MLEINLYLHYGTVAASLILSAYITFIFSNSKYAKGNECIYCIWLLLSALIPIVNIIALACISTLFLMNIINVKKQNSVNQLNLRYNKIMKEIEKNA